MKKLIAFVLTVVMLFAMSVTVYAADTVQAENGTSTQTVEGELRKTDGTLSTATAATVYVEITWTAGDSTVTATGANFTWDPSTCSYKTTETPSASGSAVYTLNITNKSDCCINYAVTYSADNNSAFTSSLKSATTNSGSVENAAKDCVVNTYSTSAVNGEAQTSGNITITVDVTAIANAATINSAGNGDNVTLGTLTCTITKDIEAD